MKPEDVMQIQHAFGGNVYAKQCLIEAGYEIDQHKHNFDHLSILAVGSVELEVDNQKTVLHAPYVLTIKANTVHKVTTLTQVLWYCLHSTDVTDVALIDSTLIHEEDPDTK